MSKPKISGIAVITKNRAFGKEGGLLFHVPGDLPRFKRITSGHPIIMGRKTFESKEINKRPLPNRTNIVITRDTLYQPEGVIVCHSLDEAIAQASKIDSNEIFIIGGGQIFAEALPRIEKLYLTIVDTEAEADVYFPDYSEFTRIVFRESRETEGLSYQFVDLERDLRSL